MKRALILIITALAVIASAMTVSAADKVLISGDGVEVTEMDLAVENKFLSENFQAKDSEKINVILMNRLFSMDARKNWDDPIAEREIKVFTEKYIGNLYRKKIKDSIRIPENTIKSYYLANPDQFMQPALYDLRIIVVPNRVNCEKLRDDIGSGKIGFSEAAEKYSVDGTSSVKGGQLEKIQKDKMSFDFLVAIGELGKGEITEPFKFSENWAILSVEDIEPTRKIDFKEVSGFIRDKLTRKEFVKKMDEAFERLKKEYKVD